MKLSLLKMSGLTDRLVSSKAEAIRKSVLLTQKPNALSIIETKKREAKEYLTIFRQKMNLNERSNK